MCFSGCNCCILVVIVVSPKDTVKEAQLLKMYVSYFDPVLSKIVLGNIICKIGIQIRYSFALFELS